MDCVKYREQVNHFIDGELELRSQTALFRHLAECPECQSLIDGLVRVKEGVRNERIPYPTELDDAVLGEILARVPAERDPVRTARRHEGIWGRRVVIPFHLAVSLAAVIVLGAFLLGRSLFLPAERAPEYGITPGGFARPQTVIFVYGMPPVEVLGSPAVKTATDLDRFNH